MKQLFIVFVCFFGLSSALIIQHSLNRVVSKKALASNSASTSQQISGYDYTIAISLGTPEQKFNVIFDTQASTFFINDIKACSACPSYCADPTFCDLVCNKDCCKSSKSFHKKDNNSPCIGFDSSKSSTYMFNNQTISNNDTMDFIGKDVLKLGGAEEQQLVIAGSTFIQRTVLKPWHDSYDGAFGLGFSSSDNIPSPLLNAINQGLLDKPLVTVYLGNVERSTSDGILTWGGLDVAHCSSDISFYPSTSSSNFQFHFDSITVGSLVVSDGFEGTVDSSYGGISGPSETIYKVARALGGNWASDYGAFVMSCTPLIDTLDFFIGGEKYSVKVKDLLSPAEGKQCVLHLSNHYQSNVWIFGAPWMQSYCNVFNYGDKSIGFAKIIA